MADKSKPSSKGKKTSKEIGTKASKALRAESSSKAVKTVSASAMAQTGTDKRTSPPVASEASKLLRSPSSSKDAKSISASDLAQAERSAAKSKKSHSKKKK